LIKNDDRNKETAFLGKTSDSAKKLILDENTCLNYYNRALQVRAINHLKAYLVLK
jgi:hypothetical protein